MDTHVFLAVLAAALCHAGWNALLKLRVEPFTAIALISIGCGIVALPMLILAGAPHPESWRFIAASLALHLLYYTALAEAYRTGDLGQAYPIARGSAPLLTAVASMAVAGERLTPLAWAGVLVLASGILMLSLAGGRVAGRIDWRTVGFALLTAATISSYTLVDGIGARLSGSVAAYMAWLLVLDGLMMMVVGLWRRGAAIPQGFRDSWPLIVAGGAMSTASYSIAVWAMTLAPIALVAALRETSVMFAAIIGVVWLGEPVRAVRIGAVLLALAGLALLRLAH